MTTPTEPRAVERMASAEWRAWITWLLKQVHRNDAVGDIARDWSDDLADGCATSVRTLSGMDRHLQSHGAIPEALDARDKAFREYRALLAQEKAD